MKHYKIEVQTEGRVVRETTTYGTDRDIARKISSLAVTEFAEFTFYRETLTAVEIGFAPQRKITAHEVPPPNGEAVETFGSRLRAARLDRKLTQQQLAQLAGIQVPTVSRLESGRRSKPNRTTIAALERVLKTKLT